MGKSNPNFIDKNKKFNAINDVDPKDVGSLIGTLVKIIRDWMK